MRQEQLEFVETHTRLFDPESSRDAARRHARSGKAASECAQVLAAVRRHPCKTSRELADLAGLDRHMVAKRLPDLLKKGVVWRDTGGEGGQFRWHAVGEN